MKTVSDYMDILITAPFSLGYLWAAGKFCRKFLGASQKRELAFAFCAFSEKRILAAAMLIMAMRP